MKTILTLTAIALIATITNAEARNQLPKKQWKGGSQCGLTDEYGSDLWREFGRSYDLGEGNPEDVASLPTIIKQQLILTAKKHLGEDGDNISNTMEAVLALREGSEANDLIVSHFEYDGREFTQVLTYGGGNPTGRIFLKGSLHMVAMIADSDVVCLK